LPHVDDATGARGTRALAGARDALRNSLHLPLGEIFPAQPRSENGEREITHEKRRDT